MARPARYREPEGDRLRIAVVASGDMARPAGSELVQLSIAKGLASKGHKLRIFRYGDGHLVAQWCAIAEHCTRVPDGARVRRAPAPLAKALVGPSLRTWQWRPDCVYVNHPSDVPLGAFLAGRGWRPVVCHLHLPYGGKRSAALIASLRRADRLVAVSTATGKSWLAAGVPASRLSVVRNGVDTSHFVPLADPRYRAELRAGYGLPADAFVVLFLGRLVPAKGVEVLLDAVRRLVEELPGLPTRLVIAGRGGDTPYGKQLMGRARGLPVTSVPWQADPRPLYWSADALAVPSLWEEPLGMVVLEAQSCGLPVVASRVGGMQEILDGKPYGQLVEPGRPGPLADALASLRDWRTSTDLGSRARANAVLHHGLERAVGQMEGVLRSCLGPRPPLEDSRQREPAG
jgi:glycosyltransferase involved in cell wall biosynthesis